MAPSTESCRRNPAFPAPRTVTDGFETFTDQALADAPADADDATTRTSERRCSDGVKCVVGLAVECRIGSYCVGGKEFLCPAGVVGEKAGLTSKNCSRACPAGAYCEVGSTAPVTCPQGFYNEQAGKGLRSDCLLCPRGSWCSEGKKTTCNEGFFNAEEGTDSQGACTRCPDPKSTTAVPDGAQSEAAEDTKRKVGGILRKQRTFAQGLEEASESGRAIEEVKAAAQMLREAHLPIRFHGFVEGGAQKCPGHFFDAKKCMKQRLCSSKCMKHCFCPKYAFSRLHLCQNCVGCGAWAYSKAS